MINDVEIDLALTGHGWADCRFRVGDASFKMSGVSYCTDALGDLVRVATLMAAGHASASFSFDGEPQEWRWLLSRSWRDDSNGSQQGLRVRILSFADIYANTQESEGVLELEAACDPDDFARAVERLADRIWREMGPDGYQGAWGDMAPFPTRALAALKAALSSPPEFTIVLT